MRCYRVTSGMGQDWTLTWFERLEEATRAFTAAQKGARNGWPSHLHLDRIDIPDNKAAMVEMLNLAQASRSIVTGHNLKTWTNPERRG